MNVMEIKVRNVDPVAGKKIDELAKEKGISRQEFLKKQSETLTFFRKQTTRNIIWKSSLIRTYSGKKLIM
jgi:hypothetical protein